MILSPEFAEFYRRQTGRDVAEFIARVVIAPDEFLGENQLRWTQAMVEAL